MDKPMTDEHIPVLYQEVLELLRPPRNGRFIDGTVGAGGHTAGILEASAPAGRVLALDKDPSALAFAQQRLAAYGDRVIFVHASYAHMGSVGPAYGFEQVDGILLDLGLSSRQLEDPGRGFSFMKEGPLDMRFDTTQGPTAADLINNSSESELANVFWRYGEVRNSRQIARLIVANRPLTTTSELADLIAARAPRRRRIHPATQVFQALRIAVNQELDEMEQGVATAVALLRPGGRLAVISFHSLEDRYVKHSFRELSRDCVCPPEQPVCTCDARAVIRLITRKAVKPSDQEVATNPRSRSARLRVIEKLEVRNRD